MARERYKTVNAAWPETMTTPTGQEAMSAVKRLYRMAMGKAWKGPMKLTSGRNHTWARRGTFYVNPNQDGFFNGWKSLVHDMSHYCHARLHPDKGGHDHRHEWLEKEMIQYVVAHGWLDGKLRREAKPETPKQELRYKRICERIEAWEAKKRRAETALKKLERSKRYYEKVTQS